MPRGKRRRNKEKNDEIKKDPHEILRNLIQKARNLTDKDIWNHSLGGKIITNNNNNNNSKSIKHHRATEKEEDEELMHEADLSSTNYVNLTSQPALIKNGQLRDYQIEGVSWLINLRHKGLHGILADEMGLGKTLQCIALLAYIRNINNITGYHLIIVPKSTIINWSREFKKWCPIFNILLLEAPNKEERKKLINNKFKPFQKTNKYPFDVVICSYEICMIEKNVLKKINYEYIIVDEAHRLKNNASKFATILRTEFTSNNRLLITGTPLQNNLRELWSLLNFLLPNLFKSADDFESMFDFSNSENEQKKIFSQLRILLQPFLLRRLKINATKDLPPKKELILFVGMSELQQDVYKKILLRDLSTLQNNSNNTNKSSLLNLVMQLRKCTNHPYLFDGVEDLSLDPFGEHLITNCGKLSLLNKLLPRLKTQKSRVLIFSQMTRVLDILEDYCAIRKYKYCRIDGSTSGEDRQTEMDEFNKKNSSKFIFLLTTRAGGLGINLQSADIVIIFDSDWNPQMDLQAMDRAHRIGQTKPVFVYRLVTKGSVEERILERAELKLRLDAMVIQKHNKTKNPNNKNELMEMIQYGADKIFKLKGSTITDNDIDAILQQSKLDTDVLNEQWHKTSKKEFNQLTLEFNYQEFDGKDYTKERKEKIKQINQERYKLIDTIKETMLKSGKATRLNTKFGFRRKNYNQINYNEDAYYRERILNTQNASILYNKNKLTPPDKLPDIRYWQLYDIDTIYKINSKEWDFFNKWKNNGNYDPDEHIPLTDDDIQLKNQLLEQGFDTISYRDFGQFVRLCVKYGRDDTDNIYKFMKDECGCNQSVIERYHSAFFRLASDIDELESHLQRIVDGEDKINARLQKIKDKEERDKKKEEDKIASRLQRLKEKEERDKKKEEEKEKTRLQRLKEKEERDKERAEKEKIKLEARLQRLKEKEERDKQKAERRAVWEKQRIEFAKKKAEKNEEKRKLQLLRMKEQEDKYRKVLKLRMEKWECLMNESVGELGFGVYKDLQLPDAKCSDVGYTKDIDKYLFILTYKYGYGNWDVIHNKLLNHSCFQFNFLLQTQTPKQIKYRMDTILRSCLASKRLVPIVSTGSKRTSREASLPNINGNNNNNKPPLKKRKINNLLSVAC